MTDTSRPRRGAVATTRTVLRRMKIHNVTVAAAGIAFYSLLALVPTMIALVSVYSLVADPNDIEDQVSDVAGSLDDTTRDFLVNQLQDIVGQVEEDAEAGATADGGISGQVGRWSALVFGVALALFSASGAVQKLMSTISLAYEAGEDRPGWMVRALAYLFTAAAIVGMSVMILTIAVVPEALDALDTGGTTEGLINTARFPALAVLFGAALTILYRYGPDRTPRTPWRNPGALVATALFVVFAIAFSVYSSNVDALPASYGLLGSIAALMIFLQLTALAIIIGAEVNGAIESRSVATDVSAVPASAVAPLGFGKALAGLAALVALGRAGTRQ